jgi:predicted DNA-binding transcriptional regulator AlpA
MWQGTSTFTLYPLPFTLYPLPFNLYPLPFTPYPFSQLLHLFIALINQIRITRPDPVDPTPTNYQEATLIDKEEAESISPDWYELLNELADKQPARSPIQNWRELEEACEKGWFLTTKQVQELAGAKPKEINGGEARLSLPKPEKLGIKLSGW